MEVPEPWFKIVGFLRSTETSRNPQERTVEIAMSISDADIETSEGYLHNLNWLRLRKMQIWITYPPDKPEEEEEEFRRLTQKVANDYNTFDRWIRLMIKHDPVLAAHAANHIDAYIKAIEI